MCADRFRSLCPESNSFPTDQFPNFATVPPTFVGLCLPLVRMSQHLLQNIPDIQWLLPVPWPTHRTWSNPPSWPKPVVDRLRRRNPSSSLVHSVGTKWLVGNQKVNHLPSEEKKQDRDKEPWIQPSGSDWEDKYINLFPCSQRWLRIFAGLSVS